MDETKAAVVSRRTTMKIGNRTIVLEALSLKDWVMAEEEALKDYKRQIIKTWLDNLDLLPEDQRDAKMQQAFERAEKVTRDQLPAKEMNVPVLGRDGKPQRDADGNIRTKPGKVPYQAWWMSETPSGQRMALYLAMHKADPSVTPDTVDELFADTELLEHAANMVGDITKPRLGNE